MKRLSKYQKKERDALIATLEDAVSDANEAIVEYNDQLLSLSPPNAELEAVNLAIEAYNGWREDIHAQMEEWYDDRSKAWQGSERGEQYAEWIEVFDEHLDDIEEDIEEPIEVEECAVETPYTPDSPEDA